MEQLIRDGRKDLADPDAEYLFSCREMVRDYEQYPGRRYVKQLVDGRGEDWGRTVAVDWCFFYYCSGAFLALLTTIDAGAPLHSTGVTRRTASLMNSLSASRSS